MSIQKKLETILANQDFAQLAPYSDPDSWKHMTLEDRELLGVLFAKHGEILMMKGDRQAADTFKMAAQVAPNCPLVFFYEALAYTSIPNFTSNIRCLTTAGKSLEKATQLDPLFTAAWHGWGDVLANIGLFYGDATFFYFADQKFAEAERVSQQDPSRRPETLYWDWGRCWYQLGNLSGEAVDYFKALEKFRTAAKQSFTVGEFYNDYGNLLVAIALLHDRQELIHEAIEQYNKAATLSPDYKIWVNLASSYQHLYELTGSEDFFFNADESFERATDLNHDCYKAWVGWGELYAFAGRKGKDIARLKESFLKFEKANECEPGDPHVMSRWGEALILVATNEESYELLKDAEAKIAIALKGLPNSSSIWHIYGTCLFEFGYYFHSVEHYKQAIEKFMHALALENANPLIYHDLGLTYYAIGDLTSDAAMIEKAVQQYNQLASIEELHAPTFWNDWGVALMKLGELSEDKKHIEDAADKFERAINIKIDESRGENVELEWLYNYGCAMDFLGDFYEDISYYEKAVQVLTHVLQTEPAYTHARYNLGIALTHLGEISGDIDCFTKAIEHFEVLLQHDPEDEITWNDLGLALLNLAVLTNDTFSPELSRKAYEQAESKFLQSIALGNSHAFYNLACSYALINNTDTAMHYIERAQLSNALPSLDDLIHDEWLDNLRNLTPFRNFISQLLSKQQKEK